MVRSRTLGGTAPARPEAAGGARLEALGERLREAGAEEQALARGREVAAILAGLGLDPVAQLAGLLHYGGRGLEGAVLRRLAEAEGEDLVALLDGVGRLDELSSRPPSGRGDELRSQRMRKLLLAIVRDVRVVLVVLAGQLVTLRAREALAPEARRELAHLALEVFAPLASRLGVWQIKWELEDRGFRELEPEAYKDIARRLDARRSDREGYIEAVVRELGTQLERSGIQAEVQGRPKHIYSIWRKMRHKGLDFDQLFDLRAVRVLVDSIPQCYAALGVVHTCWPHVPHEFDDYITNPKPNGYQSLHTAVIGPEGKTLEVQIRTRRMHEEAELGVAAHWRYKEGERRRIAGDARIRWLRRLLEWHDSGEGAADLAAQFNAELFQDRVYVFTPRGDIVDLPAGATPLDFAYQVHTEVGHRCRGAKVNGSIVPLTYRLRSGDKVEVLTTRQPRPSRDWLNPHLGYLASARARAKVRQWYKQQDYERNLADGQEIYAREVRRLGVSGIDGRQLAARFRFTSFDDLLAAIGRGDVSSGQLAGALQQQLPEQAVQAPVVRARRASRSEGEGGDIRVEGVGDLLTQLARCCAPLPPDPIVGYITRGRGVSVHRRDCANVLRLGEAERARLVDVEWRRAGARSTYPVDIEVSAFDRKGLLRDITSVIANEGVNVVALESHGEGRGNEVRTRLTVEVEDLPQLARVLDRLAQLANVSDARRCGGG